MQIQAMGIPSVLLLEPQVFQDNRGFFLESFNQRVFHEVTQTDYTFVQDNHTLSKQGVLRGLHYQLQQTQGKLVRVIQGRIYDVVVDLRRSSPSFGQWVSVELKAEDQRLLWVPPGFAHGFYVLSTEAEVLYKATDYYHPASERTLAWDDPTLNIDWPLRGSPILSVKDQAGVAFEMAEVFA